VVIQFFEVAQVVLAQLQNFIITQLSVSIGINQFEEPVNFLANSLGVEGNDQT